GRNINEVRGFNRAADAYRQPGSSFKPIVVYGPALEMGWNPGNVLDDYPGGFTVEKDFVNSDNTYRGLVTLRTAVMSSLNTIAVKLIERIGVENGIAFAKKLGITSLVESGRYNDMGPAVALGGVTKGISPIELTAAFATYGNNGIFNKPYAIRRIEDHRGNVIYEHTPDSRVAMTPQTAYLMTDLLISAVSGGTGTRARLDRPTAGKTGTTSLNVDAWFAGYTPDLAGALWMGYDIPDRMPGVFGGTYCAPLWKEIMSVAHRDMPVTEFPAAEGIRSATIDAKSGMLPSPLTPEEFIISERFNAAFLPSEESNVWIQAPVCAESGLLLTDDCPLAAMHTFLRRAEPWVGNVAPQDAVLEVPAQFCGIHGSGAFIAQPDDDSTQLRLYAQVDRQDEATNVNLSWYASKADANTVFLLFRAESPNTPANAATRLAVLNYTSATFTDVFQPEDSGEYYYYIQAVDKSETAGDILGVSPEAKAYLGNRPYYAGDSNDGRPSILILEGALIPYGSGHAVQLLWNEINPDNEAVYQIYRSEDPNFTVDASTMLMQAGNLYNNSYTDTNVFSGRTYYYRVAGVDLTLGVPIPQSTRLYATIP
ncbi:MAG: penicillin-binding transpeptidase domain-containing protein, partial [Clostridiales bacterium]|nr:penicillin-binding transpeptidase domain-containing protein [Clostridiales bacterium]